MLQATRDAIAGSEESSLAGQLKLLRTDFEDRNRVDRQAREEFANTLWQRLEQFAQMLSRSATEQVMEALKQVIVDFNRNLTEQFGDNFKALDASVQKLVAWQEGYRQQLEQLHGLYGQSVQAIVSIESAVANIAESSASIPATMDRLEAIVETATHQLAELERHLAAFQEMRDRAVEAVPQVQAHVEKMAADMAASVQTASEHHDKLLDNADRYIKAQDDKAQEMLATFAAAGERLEGGAQAVQQQIADSLQQMQQRMAAALKEAADGMAAGMAASVQTASEHHVKLLDNADRYIKAQDDKAQEMLATFAAAGERLEGGAQAVQQQIADSLQQMQQRMAATLKEAADGMAAGMAASVQTASEHHVKLLDNADRYIKAQDDKAQEMLATFAAAGERLEGGAQAVQQQIADSLQQMQQRMAAALKEAADGMAADMAASVQTASEHYRKLLDVSDTYVKAQNQLAQDLLSTLTQAGEQIQHDTQAVQQQAATGIQQMQQRMEAAVDEVLAAQNRATEQAAEGLVEQMRQSVSRTREGVNAQLQILDEAMQQELNRVMNEMGTALAQIAGKFTEDYERLTNAMDTIVRTRGNRR